MNAENWDYNKIPILVKIGYFISSIGFAYSREGFKGVYNYLNVTIRMKMFKWKYKHCKKFRNKLQENAKQQGDIVLAMLDNIMNDTPIDIKSIYNGLTDEQKDKMVKSKDEIIENVIRENNITDEKQIQDLKESFAFIK